MHPIYSLLIRRPELVIDHVAGYAMLVQEEATDAGKTLAYQAIAWAVALLGLIVFLILAGVAVMLGATLGRFQWSLVLTPGAALLVSAIAWAVAHRRAPARPFAQLKAQLDADRRALRAAQPAA